MTCKICNRIYQARGFCKLHLSMFYRSLIDQDGKPRDGYFLNGNGHIRKIKCMLRKQVNESDWFRKWKSARIKSAGYKCQICGAKLIKLYVHHDKSNSFSSIIKEAKNRSTSIIDQEIYCKLVHETTPIISTVVCRKCHASLHPGKLHNFIARIRKSDLCVVCKKEPYCKGFCHYHYQQYRKGIRDISGKKLRPLKYERKKSTCIVCGQESRGCSGDSGKFCKIHFSRFRNEIIDSNGKTLREPRIIDGKRTCKVCGSKHYGLGFCLTHYNRFKIGQLDTDGNELRPLEQFVVKGMKMTS